jgi:hypothetical protein
MSCAMLCMLLCQTPPAMSLNDVRREYSKYGELLMEASKADVKVQEVKTEQDIVRTSSDYVSFDGWRALKTKLDVGTERRSEDCCYLSPTTSLRLFFQPGTTTPKSSKYIRHSEKQNDALRIHQARQIRSLAASYEIPPLPTALRAPIGTTVDRLLTEFPDCELPGKVIRVETLQTGKQRRVRLYYLILHDSQPPPFQYKEIAAHGYVDLAPDQSWVVTGGNTLGNASWSVEYEGMIRGIPRVKAIKERREITVAELPTTIHESLIEVTLFEPATSINRDEFFPQYHGLSTKFDAEPPKPQPGTAKQEVFGWVLLSLCSVCTSILVVVLYACPFAQKLFSKWTNFNVDSHESI